MHKRERGDDTVGDQDDSSLRSRTGEAALESAIGSDREGFTPHRPKQEAKSAEGNCLQSELDCPRSELDDSHIGEMSEDNGKRLMSGGTCPGTMSGGAGLGKRQPQLSTYSFSGREYVDNCGSERRRVHEKTRRKAGENTMMERLEGDEMIE